MLPDAAVKAKLAAAEVISKKAARSGTPATTSSSPSAGPARRHAAAAHDAYSTFANGGTHYRPLIAVNVLAPGTPDAVQPGVGRPQPGQRRAVHRHPGDRYGQPAAIGARADPPGPRRRDPQLRNGPKGTAVETFRTYNYAAFPIAGKTGTAQDDSKLSENDTSLFVGFGPIKPNTPAQYTIGAVLEKAGFGAEVRRAGGEVHVRGRVRAAPDGRPDQSEPLDKDAATTAAVLPPLADTSCLVNPPTDIND